MSVSSTATRVKLYGYKVLVEEAAVYNPGSLITQSSEWLYLQNGGGSEYRMG